MSLRWILHTVGFISLLACCAPKQAKEETPRMTQQEMDEALIARNRAMLKQERENIKIFIDSSGSIFDQTGSGLFYTIVNKSAETQAIAKGDLIEYEFEIKTLSGKFLESSMEAGNKSFRLFTDDELIGIHEGVALMHLYDEYLFIMPAHLAYGITNQNGAPLNATLLYKVKIVSIN